MDSIISDCARAVFTELGSGYTEAVYHRAMEVELRRRGICYESKSIVPVIYEGYRVGYGEADLIVFLEEGTVVVELKATTYYPRASERAQIQTYMRGRPELNADGIIINFRQPNATSSPDNLVSIDCIWVRASKSESSTGSSGSCSSPMLSDTKKEIDSNDDQEN